ncbi:hypothetical protein BROUX41_002720 [Berkeleyomyces rouxiae]|uniref:uncharacterized protein n=1 Tax=Berkeleyomyces rouxiae TaxID=2035830 RepID=UPI003B7A8D32
MDAEYQRENRGGVILPAVSSLIALTTFFVGLRLYTRAVLSHSVSWDDLLTVVAYLIALAEGILMIIHVDHGQGRHWDTLSFSEQVTYLQIFYSTIVLYTAALGIVKTAILLQYLRIFTGKLRKVTIICMILIGMWSTAILLVIIFPCRPVRLFWDKSVDGYCIPDLPLWYINAGCNILTDLIITILPIRTLWKLQLPRSQRLSLIAVFALGFFTCAISLIRVFALSIGADPSYKNINAAIWSCAEVSCALITSSLPTLRPILYRILPRIFHPLTRSSAKKTNPSSISAGYAIKSSRTVPEDESPLTMPPGTSTDKLSSHSGDIELQAGMGSSRSGDSTYKVVMDGDKPKKHSNMLPNDQQSYFTTVSVGRKSRGAETPGSDIQGINVRTETVIKKDPRI